MRNTILLSVIIGIGYSCIGFLCVWVVLGLFNGHMQHDAPDIAYSIGIMIGIAVGLFFFIAEIRDRRRQHTN